MLAWLLGIAGFCLYLLYDINSITIDSRPLRLGFALGTALVATATLIEAASAYRAGAFRSGCSLLFLLLAASAFAALLYCLFFALPFDETYRAPSRGRMACTRGVYALCRHPGVLCFWALYLFLGCAAANADFFSLGLLFSALNTLYAWFQDRVTFPRTFCNYETYRTEVPFLLPTARSVRRAVQTWGRSSDEEVDR